jgi:hypothetical protein
MKSFPSLEAAILAVAIRRMTPMTYSTPRITPYLLYEDLRGALDWLAKAFGFSLRHPIPNAEFTHAEMQVGDDGVIMMGHPGPQYRNPKRQGQRLKIFMSAWKAWTITSSVLLKLAHLSLKSRLINPMEIGATALRTLRGIAGILPKQFLVHRKPSTRASHLPAALATERRRPGCRLKSAISLLGSGRSHRTADVQPREELYLAPADRVRIW